MIRTLNPGIGRPQEPGILVPLGELSVIAVDVSVAA